MPRKTTNGPTTGEIPRDEHPHPQFQRTEWSCLNGTWSFEIDPGNSGVERGLPRLAGFAGEIQVPFCMESPLSGVGLNDFTAAVWYQRSFSLPESWYGHRILLHFEGVDYEANVYIDGGLAATHFGGGAAFTVDITDRVRFEREHNLVVRVADELRSRTQPAGKQSVFYASAGCLYTRVTGIWGTVWLEPVAHRGLDSVFIIPNLERKGLDVLARFPQKAVGCSLKVSVYDRSKPISEVTEKIGAVVQSFVPVDPIRLWSPDDPHLYDLELTVTTKEGAVLDRVRSYAGLRSIGYADGKFTLNGEPLYLRLVLDQGYYPDGIWTAPTDQALRRDIELGMEAGFNGARLHQRVFDERYLYYADQLGYLTWAEAPSWGLDLKSEHAARNFLSEWREIVEQKRNHPSIICWTPLNETWDVSRPSVHNRLHTDAYYQTKAADPTRPVNDASGGCHVLSDIYSVHIYEQDPEKLREMLAIRSDGGVYRTLGDKEAPYCGEPYIISEFGGIKWVPGKAFSEESWGYGRAPQTLEEFYERLQGQVRSVLSHKHISGYCYTQLTDVEQEENGLYHYNRELKFDIAKLRDIFSADPPWWGSGR